MANESTTTAPEQVASYVAPTLLIGLGGTGKDVLLRIRRMFYERHGKRADGSIGFPIVGYLALNPNARYIKAGRGAFANGGRQTLPLDGINNFDLGLTKRFAITERVGLDFRAELFNALNQVIFGGPQISITSGDFGRIRLSQVNTPRQVQFGMRLGW